MKKKIILIVDDDMDDREIIRDAFMSARYNATEFIFLDDGDSVIKYLATESNTLPDLIMLDLNMPGKDGWEVLREIKTNTDFSYMPTIVFTTSSSQRDSDTAYNLGANCFVTKPDTFSKMVDLASSISKLWLPEFI
jgi:CheY-like chemotaxis protein